MSNLPSKPVRVSLAEAASDLQEMVRMLDDGEDITPYMESFSLADDHAVAAIERRKYILKEISAKRTILNSMLDEVKKHIQKIELVEDRIKQTTKDVLEQNPKVSFRDSLGNKVYLCKSKSYVKFDDFVSLSREYVGFVVAESAFKKLTIDGYGKYLKRVSFDFIDVEAVKRDLDNGEVLSFAKLVNNTHVRGL